jgi:hypothetical protein
MQDCNRDWFLGKLSGFIKGIAKRFMKGEEKNRA